MWNVDIQSIFDMLICNDSRMSRDVQSQHFSWWLCCPHSALAVFPLTLCTEGLSFLYLSIKAHLTCMPLERGWKLEHLGEACANNMRSYKIHKAAKWNLCPSCCDTAALTAEPHWLSGLMSPQSSCIMPWRMEDSCTPSPRSEPSHLTHLLDLDNKVTVTLTVWM